ncbi:MAG: mucoidy inhibitor MuiA family protein [Flavobacteriales bacterium]|nr:mucoidy inhibitor MuiA family protein [Flavobacteriales bacterium]
MRTILFSLVLIPLLANAGDERPIPSKITEAKVFLTGAQVARSATTKVPAGTSTFVFTGLAEALDPQSIQVTGKGGYQILSVNHRMNYLTESPKKKELEELRTRIKKLEKDYAYEKAMQDVWVNEEQLLQKNASIGGQQNGITASQLTAVNDYVRERLKAIKTNWLLQQEKLTALHEDAEKLRQQAGQLQAQAPRPTSEVVVEISSTTEVSATFGLSYFVRNAGWAPAYDLRATGVGKPIELSMKAQVTNNSGEDWDKVDLSLSSGNPTLGGVMPALSPWTLYMPRIMQTQGIGGVRKERAMMDAAPSMASGGVMQLKDEEEMEASTIVWNTTENRTTTVEFVIQTPFNVPSDGVPHMIGVSSQMIPATYKHYVTPKRDKDAFLYARTTGWEDLNLLPGQANVFFEGTFVGQSYLQLDIPNDTLEISLGRDKGVTVERVKRKTTNEKASIGSKRTVTIGWDITVRNTKVTAIDLEVRDQYPLSPQSEIEVKLEERGEATVNEQTGLLTWNLTVTPKETKKLGFSYTVKYPKEMPVVLE